MILNTYSVLAAFVALAELVLGGLALVLGARAARRPEASGGGADPAPLLHLTASRLILLGAASVPLVYLMLRSYVTEWPGVMCVQGVTRVGGASVGAASWLPPLLVTMLAAKCALLIATGAWMTLHAADRRTRTAPLARQVAAWIAIAGALAVVDAASSIAYVAIPKRETRLAVGCCTASALTAADPALPGDADLAATARRRAAWTAAFLGLGAATTVLAGATLRRGVRDVERPWWTFAAAGGGVATAVAGTGFLGAALSPARLRMPLHECGWCLVDRAPEIWLGIAGTVAGTACLVWAAIAARAARRNDLRDTQAGVAGAVQAPAVVAAVDAAVIPTVRPLLEIAVLGYAAALVMTVVELWMV